nr:MAG TPA: hypothetical protein [Caudoviricetes sp.]
MDCTTNAVVTFLYYNTNPSHIYYFLIISL